MTLFSYRFGIRFFTLLGLLSLLVFVFGLDPKSLSVWGMVFFFVSLWVVACGIFSLTLLFAYEKTLGAENTAFNIGSIFRQAILLGSFVLGVACLFYFHVFVWWNATLFFIFILLLELTLRKFSRHTSN